MIQERRGKSYGRTISEWIALVPNELARDAVNLCQILSAGQFEFELTGPELVQYVRQNLVALVEAGAIPVVGGKGTGYEWIANYNYGLTKHEIVAAIVAEWLASNGDEMYPWTVWFALARDNPGYIKM